MKKAAQGRDSRRQRGPCEPSNPILPTVLFHAENDRNISVTFQKLPRLSPPHALLFLATTGKIRCAPFSSLQLSRAFH